MEDLWLPEDQGRYDLEYSYDDAGNKEYFGGTIGIYPYPLISYGAGNREAAVATGYPLGYDFKGNVTSRNPLSGGSSYFYSWDAYDRLSGVFHNYQGVSYAYDPSGRMLKRSVSGGDTTENYWLGLNRIAIGRWTGASTADDPVWIPYYETTSNPLSEGWYNYYGSGTRTATYVTDSTRGKVVLLNTTATGATPAYWMIGDYNNMNPNDTDFTAGGRDVVGMWVKSENSGQPFNIPLCVITSAGVMQITYHSNAVTESHSGSNITARIPGQSLSAFANGQWHYIELPVTQTLQQWIPGATVGSGSSGVVGIMFNGKRLFVDDIVISSTKLDRSYQVVPGAAISGVLGSFTGPNVVADHANRVRYFHYNAWRRRRLAAFWKGFGSRTGGATTAGATVARPPAPNSA